MKKYIIWQNYNINPEEEDYKDYLGAYYPDITNEEKKYCIIEELNNYCLDDEKARLDILLDDDIIVIANIGLWNGRRRGYNGDCISGRTASNASCAYGFLNDKNRERKLIYHYTKKGSLIIDYITIL